MALIALWGCAGPSALDELNGSTPAGTPFDKALFDNYSFLAHSLADSGIVSPARDQESGFFGGTDSESLAETFARKAITAGQGINLPPEEAPGQVQGATNARDILIRLLDSGARVKAPQASARAQAGFDCWVLNAQISGQDQAAATCKATFEGSLRAAGLTIAPAPMAASAPAAPPVGPEESFAAYFGWDTWALSGEALQAITQAVQAAHDGRQSHIDVVGHTDTSGTASYNQVLSERRASVVRDVMIQMGARPEAVTAKGVGESELAVPTADSVREPKNRRTVMILIP